VKSSKNRIHISFIDYLKYFCKRKPSAKPTKVDILKKGEELIRDKFNILFMLNKFMEMETLKLLLLDKDQFHLFNYMPKPMLGDFEMSID
jgi:hypothetical protein